MPGGRDIDPKKYGQKNEGGSKVPEDSHIRYDFNENAFTHLPTEMPIFGICWGLQFMNVYFGGDLVQDMENSQEHYKKRRVTFKEGSILYKAVGSETLSQCYHHQSIGKIGKGIKVTGIDDFSKEPHAMEYVENGRWIVSVLWHPEATFIDESRTLLDENSLKMLGTFIKKCKEYKELRKKRKK